MPEIFAIPLGLIVIFGLRLLVPLTIFRWPLWGGIVSLLIDALDTNIVKPFGVEIPNYTTTDKYLDTYYLTIELIVSLGWVNKLAKSTSIFLYSWRLVGLVAFQFTAWEPWLFIAPNLFENFFLFIVLWQWLGKETREKFWLNSPKRLAIVLFLLWLPKIPQELILHVWKARSPIETFLAWFSDLF
ncbi:MAG: hypothetical protein A2126_00650 [Candidatus Woykebacteria bacterium GWB1_45_5]|uniref:CDP-alcohol phosphatidyltransferase n=2 Tax=Candidatus Woykeibacteriota TaxID=1817899 RepID=A0A1G1W2R5_9BACT|nr:MAG: hypothetical protein A2113_00930 [Candidatus Woykebacteria bacterium GWA1_44_8]OGY24229.1 MAG: hypothetical protein A2126_00650 [Candidatus Woykebacteria bacterium GWB1_45_5]